MSAASLEKIRELLYSAGVPTIPIIRDFDQESFEALQNQLNEPAWLGDVETDLHIRGMIGRLKISEAVRTQCEQEMAEGKRSGWRL